MFKKIAVLLFCILVLLTIAILSVGAGSATFTVNLSGRDEVPTNDSRAHGQASFQLSDDGTTLHFRLIVGNIQNVTMAHIHLAPAGELGDPVVWLYPAAPPPQLIEGRSSGILVEGSITAANLVGPLAGGTMADLVAQIEAGNTYVNVHTSAIPSGEIRGQIK
jgi:hypothetical protein